MKTRQPFEAIAGPTETRRFRPVPALQLNCSGFVADSGNESVANVLKREKQIEILRLLSEGNSVRATMRLTGIEKKTITRIVVRFGNACRDFLDESLANLSLRHIQCDEIWTFVRMKEKVASRRRLDNSTIGDQYLYTALDTDTKLLVTFAVGKRSSEVTHAFIADLEKRLVRPPVLSQDAPQLDGKRIRVRSSMPSADRSATAC